ncbi:stress response protein [Peptococcaceae bacterium SCADC1_2_3]|jgi:sporulation protein YhbH|nr:stress response protein [Peptococcaceae bacterium SCADC1_2_3]KFI37677.1 stress response protein [Peptococcaceae bacterium SCADC1_2_3]HBQ29223.1 sporulation protein YhbH [Desulfotomaculum sp.]HCJ78964.1 sporulation protein YhbH [Desulfotomaculum sp.]
MSYTISREDWSLHRKGELDRQRHQEKVKEAIKKNLPDLISEESIIMADGDKIIKIPIRSLEEYHFRFDQGKQKHIGQGKGKSEVGDLLGQTVPKSDKGPGAGEQPGVDYYEAEITIDELAEMIFADLGLPNLKQKIKAEITSEAVEFKDVRKKGISSNIDRKRTILEAIKRQALKGKGELPLLIPEDLRYKTWELTYKYESNAVVLAMMDTSGSMGTYEKYIARSFFFWMVRFLRTKYQNVQIVFLTHHTEAKETNEKEFFTKGESGGTRCSSVYKLAIEITMQRFNPQDYNVYAFHFSDGDNLTSDNDLCVKLINELLKICNQVGYGEIEGPYYYTTTLRSFYKKVEHPNFTIVTIKDKTQVYPALKKFFSL